MADGLDTLLMEYVNAIESYGAIADMYPPDHVETVRARERIATAKQRVIADVVAGERIRCRDIIMAVRFHEIETDLRSVISFIERGDTADELKAERAKHR